VSTYRELFEDDLERRIRERARTPSAPLHGPIALASGGPSALQWNGDLR
jgi:hypothetical protein